MFVKIHNGWCCSFQGVRQWRGRGGAEESDRGGVLSADRGTEPQAAVGGQVAGEGQADQESAGQSGKHSGRHEAHPRRDPEESWQA